jgi:tetratricopeptide (TPR) repeat protein
MLTKDMHKKEILETLENKGDFVQIDYLTRYLKKMPPLEMRKFAFLKLAEIYLKKEMYINAAKMFRNIAINSLTFKDKQKYFLKETKSYILAEKFEDADKALKRTLAEGNSKEKKEIYENIIDFYKKVGEKFENKLKKEKASKIYEKLFEMKLPNEEKEMIKKKLLKFYEKLGKRKEADFLRNH